MTGWPPCGDPAGFDPPAPSCSSCPRCRWLDVQRSASLLLPTVLPPPGARARSAPAIHSVSGGSTPRGETSTLPSRWPSRSRPCSELPRSAAFSPSFRSSTCSECLRCPPSHRRSRRSRHVDSLLERPPGLGFARSSRSPQAVRTRTAAPSLRRQGTREETSVAQTSRGKNQGLVAACWLAASSMSSGSAPAICPKPFPA